MDGPVVNLAMAGIGGYGDLYLEALLPKLAPLNARLVGVADPQPQRCCRLNELREAGVPVRATLDELFDRSPASIDLMLIVTPIHLHAEQTCLALARGANVLCEKPLAGTLPDALRMLEGSRAAPETFVAIGYQWSFSQAVQALKRDVMGGLLGRPVRLKSLVFFPRPLGYFRRNDWAGRVRSDDGRGVYDSPANNAAAHYLHNMFYVLGATRETSAMPASVRAELYRANAIENYDTAAVRCVTEGGAELLFYATHAVAERRGPRFRYEFEHATVEYDAMGTGQIVARFADGRAKYYGHPNLDRHEKIWQAIDAVRTAKPLACGIPAAMPHALCVAAAQESAGQVHEFAPRIKRTVPLDGDMMVTVDRLGEQLMECYDRGILPAEHPEATWSRPGAPIDLTQPAKFPPRREPPVTVEVFPDPRPWAAARAT